MRPRVQNLVVTLHVRDDTAIVQLPVFEDGLLGIADDFRLRIGRHKIVSRERQTTSSALFEPDFVHVVQQLDRRFSTQNLVAVRDHHRKLTGSQAEIVEIHSVREHHVEADSTACCFNDPFVLTRVSIRLRPSPFGQLDLDRSVHVHDAGVKGKIGFFKRGERHAFAFAIPFHHGDKVTTHHGVLRRTHNRSTVRRTKDIVCREHQCVGFNLSFNRQWQVHRHLVAVKVGVEPFTNKRMQVNRVTFNEHRLECLNSHAVKRRSTIQ